MRVLGSAIYPFFLFFLLVLGGFAQASESEGYGPPDNRPPDNRPPDRDHDHVEPIINAVSSSIATGGEATGGNATGGEGGAVNVGNVTGGSGDSSTSVNISNKRRAPGIAVYATSGTAPYMRCIGGGGSTTDGSAGGWYCWLHKDIYAQVRMETLSDLGLFLPAAKAYCSRPIHWQDFDDRDACEASIFQSFHDAALSVLVGMVPEVVSEVVGYDNHDPHAELVEQVAMLRAEVAEKTLTFEREATQQRRVVARVQRKQQQQQTQFEQQIQTLEERPVDVVVFDAYAPIRAKIKTIHREYRDAVVVPQGASDG